MPENPQLAVLTRAVSAMPALVSGITCQQMCTGAVFAKDITKVHEPTRCERNTTAPNTVGELVSKTT
jgi:exopolysaccharide biosynthesis protein